MAGKGQRLEITLPDGTKKPVLRRKDRKWVEKVKELAGSPAIASVDIFQEAERQVYGDKSATNGKYRARLQDPAMKEALQKVFGMDDPEYKKEFERQAYLAMTCQHPEFKDDPKLKLGAWKQGMNIGAAMFVETKSRVTVTDEDIKNMTTEQLVEYINKKGEEEPEAKTETIQ